ncbi:MAG: hypothetical protein MSJ26_00165 [Oscillospiraceae bacterium]|nr:hypothetical protein [Oscillospiraceae bacterium]
MDITTFYELRKRLYASAASGCGAVNEDFRLSRAIEAFEPLAQANKAFMKLYSDCKKLFTSDSPADVLADCIALADALAVVQGGFSDPSETVPSKINSEMKIIPVTYSALSELCEKIEKCSSKLSELSAEEARLISDGRVLSAFIKAAGRGNVFLDDFAENVIAVWGEAVVPMLKNSIDLTDEKASGARVDYIYKATGEKENDYYISLAKNTEAPQDIRIAAIKAMENLPENSDILLELYNTEKGKIKNAALMAVLKLDPPEADAILAKLIEKATGNYDKYADHVRISPSRAAEDLVRAQITETSQTIRSKDKSKLIMPIENTISLFKNKSGIADCYLEALNIIRLWRCGEQQTANYYASLNNMLISNLTNKENDKFRRLIEDVYSKEKSVFLPAYFFMNFIESPEKAVDIFSEKLKKQQLNAISFFSNIRYSYAKKAYYTKYVYNPVSARDNDDSENVSLFESIPDSILDFIRDPSEINKAFYGRLYCSLQNFINGCAPHDRERIISAVLDAAFTMSKGGTSYSCISLIADYCPQTMADRCKGIVSEYILNLLITEHCTTSDCSIINRLPLSYSDKIDELTELLNRVARAKGSFTEATRESLMRMIRNEIDSIMKG